MASNRIFDINLEPINDATKVIAEVELRETPERKLEATAALRKLLKESTDLHFGDDEEFLSIFLRPCKHYPESAFALMRRVADFRRKYYSVIGTVMPADEKETFIEGGMVNILINLDQDGRRVLVVKPGSWDPSKISMDQLFRMFYLITVMAMLSPDTQVRGAVVILDFSNLSLKQVRALSPSYAMRMLTFVQEAMPLRIKQIHILKEPMIFKLVWAMIRPFFQEKLRHRVHFHRNNMSSLHELIAPDCLPKDYDGLLPAIDYSGADWYPVVGKYEEHIRKWNSYGYVMQQ